MNWFYHEKNIDGKIKKDYKNLRNEIKQFKKQIYINFKNEILDIQGYDKDSCVKKVDLLNDYLKEANKLLEKYPITPQSKFRPTILEEFPGYLFKDLQAMEDLELDIFNKNIFAGLKIKSDGHVKIQTKDVDFCIGKKYKIKLNNQTETLIIPLVSIECKTYLDKTMFSEAQFTAQKLKNGTPSVKVYIFTEKNQVGLDKLPSQSPIDEIFVIRQDKNKIQSDVIYDFFLEVSKVLKIASSKEEIELPGRLLNYKKN